MAQDALALPIPQIPENRTPKRNVLRIPTKQKKTYLGGKKRSHVVFACNFSGMALESNKPYMHHSYGDWAVPLKLAHTA